MLNQSSPMCMGLNKHKGVAALIALYSFSLLFLCIVALIALFDPELKLSTLMRDPVAVLRGHQFTGLVSNVGILLWAAAVSICFFSHVLYTQSRRSAFLARFFLWFGFLTLVLLLDDLFLLHEESSDVRIPKIILFPFYGSYLILCMRNFWRLLSKRESILFWLSLIFFGVSVGIDSVVDAGVVSLPSNSTTFVEDAFKFIGIVSWAGFLVNISVQTLVTSLNKSSEHESHEMMGMKL
ncbi:MAG: hypothetical protein F6J95_006575 [Leptolyngbya sp. SIO1E4]|nr:hypothetical protein [Leptolyngbya sp. SIO1E4]